MGMDKIPYFKNMEIDNRSVTKMRYVLNKDGVWISKTKWESRGKSTT